MYESWFRLNRFLLHRNPDTSSSPNQRFHNRFFLLIHQIRIFLLHNFRNLIMLFLNSSRSFNKPSARRPEEAQLMWVIIVHFQLNFQRYIVVVLLCLIVELFAELCHVDAYWNSISDYSIVGPSAWPSLGVGFAVPAYAHSFSKCFMCWASITF